MTARSLSIFGLLIVLYTLSLSACAIHNKACLKDKLDHHEIRNLSFWQGYLQGKVEDRIDAPPEKLVEYLNMDNRLNDFPARPEAAPMPPAFRSDLRQALLELPEPVKAVVKDKLIGIFIVKDLGTTGYTEAIADERGKLVAGFIVLDISALDHAANDWATRKERTVFLDDGVYQLQVAIEDGVQNNRKNAIQFILLHELGHVVSIGERFHPSWLDHPETLKAGDHYEYYSLSWRRSEDGVDLSLFEDVFPERKDVHYYGDARLKAAQMGDIYRRLAQTNFVSLYGATNPFDDFAEAFALYVHGRLMKKPYRVMITKTGEVVSVYESCWDEQRCMAKKAVLENLFQSAPP